VEIAYQVRNSTKNLKKTLKKNWHLVFSKCSLILVTKVRCPQEMLITRFKIQRYVYKAKTRRLQPQPIRLQSTSFTWSRIQVLIKCNSPLKTQKDYQYQVFTSLARSNRAQPFRTVSFQVLVQSELPKISLVLKLRTYSIWRARTHN